MLEHNSFFGWLLVGLVAGVLGKVLMPGRDPGGLIVTILIGMAGALLAGFVVRALNWRIADGWPGYAAATVGAIALLFVYRIVIARRS